MNKALVSLVIFLLSPVSYAGGLKVGNGGNILNCETGSVYNNIPLDYYELTERYKLTPQYTAGQNYVMRNVTVDILNRLSQLHSNFGFYLTFEVFTFEISTEHQDYLEFSGDAISKLPKGCHLKTVILQLPLITQYTVTADFYKLDPLYQEVLKFHEAIYNLALKNNPSLRSSKHVRALTAYLFSKEFVEAESSAEIDRLLSSLF